MGLLFLVLKPRSLLQYCQQCSCIWNSHLH